MKDEAAAGLDRSAMVHGAIRSLAGLDLELLKKSAEAHSCSFVTDADSDRSILIVHAKRDHRPLETRVGHARHGKKQLTGKEPRLVHWIALRRASTGRKP